MQKQKLGEIATILVIVSLIVLGIGTVISSSLISRQKMTTNSRAAAPACLTRTPNNADDCVTGGNTGATIGHCVPQGGKWYRCDKEGENNRWYGPVDDQAICEATAVCKDTTSATQSATTTSTSGACGGVKTGYGNCSAVAAVGACVYRSYAPVDPHYFNQWIYCCSTDNYWYAKDTNSQDPAKGWQKESECIDIAKNTQVGVTTAQTAQTGTSGGTISAGGTTSQAAAAQAAAQAAAIAREEQRVIDDKLKVDADAAAAASVAAGKICPEKWFKAVDFTTQEMSSTSFGAKKWDCQVCGDKYQIACDATSKLFTTACKGDLVQDRKDRCIECGGVGEPICDKTGEGFSSGKECDDGFSINDVVKNTCKKNTVVGTIPNTTTSTTTTTATKTAANDLKPLNPDGSCPEGFGPIDDGGQNKCAESCMTKGHACATILLSASVDPLPYYCSFPTDKCYSAVELAARGLPCSTFTCDQNNISSCLQQAAKKNLPYCSRVLLSDIFGRPLQVCCWGN